MRCPFCSGLSTVTETRALIGGFALRRLRRCTGTCKRSFSSYEIARPLEPQIKRLVSVLRRRAPLDPQGAGRARLPESRWK